MCVVYTHQPSACMSPLRIDSPTSCYRSLTSPQMWHRDSQLISLRGYVSAGGGYWTREEPEARTGWISFIVVCFITKSFLTYSFFPPPPALSTISRPMSSSMCSITSETANVGSSYNRMWCPGISCWFSDRSICSHWSLTLTFISSSVTATAVDYTSCWMGSQNTWSASQTGLWHVCIRLKFIAKKTWIPLL